MNHLTTLHTRSAAATERAVTSLLFNFLDIGLVVVDTETFETQLVNHTAQRLLNSALNAGLLWTIKEGRVCGTCPKGSDLLQQAKEQAQRGVTSLLASDVSVMPSLFVPMPSGSVSGGEDLAFFGGSAGQKTPLALLVFGKNRLCQSSTWMLYAKAFQLTPAEQKVLVAVFEGLAAHEIANQQQVKVSTVRSHLKSIREKTGTHNLRQVMSHLSSLPSVSRPSHI